MARVWIAGVVGVGMLGLGGTAGAETWQSYTFATGQTENTRMQAIAERVEEATGGEIEIHHTTGGGLPISGNDVQQAVAEDIIQFGQAGGGAVSFVPIFGLSRIPGLYENGEEFADAVELLRPYFDEDFAEKGVTVLCTFLYPQQTIFARQEVDELSDLDGLRVRVTSPEQALIIEALGGVPVTLVASDVPPALQQGAVDAVLTAGSGGGHIWADLLSHNYRVPINWSQGFVLVNQARFEALDDETQATIRQISEEECQGMTDGLLGGEAEVMAGLEEDGMVVTEARPDDLARLREISSSLWEDYAAEVGEDGIAALAEIRDMLGR